MERYLNQRRLTFLSSLIFALWANSGLAQSISGLVHDEHQKPIPFANVFIRELNTGTATNEQGRYFLTLNPGIYHLVISSVGYQSATAEVVVGDRPLKMDFMLEPSDQQLNEIVVKANRKDPAYEIIQKVIENKENYIEQVKTYKTNVYVKAMEVVDNQKKKKREEEEEDLTGAGPPIDPFAEEKKKEQDRLDNINMVEMQLVLNFQYPNQFKEERTAHKAYGRKEGLFIPLFSETDFNFYHNLVNLKGLAEAPLISPLSRTAILSYKYKLEETFIENDQLVYKIRVIPRKTGNSTCKGHLFINDSSWNINRLELELYKGGLRFYDAFSIKQNYQPINDSLWIPYRQEFSYQTQAGSKSFEGNTVLSYSDYQKDYAFPPKFFGNEVSITTKEAFQRDSSYWNSSRPEPLTIEQQKMVNYRDSLEAVHKSKEYLDSIEASFNKITFGEVLYHGVGFRKEAKKRNIYISPFLSLLGFDPVSGFRIRPYTSYFKKYENGRMISTFGSLSYGIKNQDLQGDLNIWARYNPFKLGDVSFRTGRNFYSINSFDAYLNQLRVSNYILHDYAHIFHKIELFNGFYLSTDLAFHNRLSIDDYDRTSILEGIVGENEPLIFEDYKSLISNIKISYTPGQRYMTEPNQKVVLGSKYPTFSFTHRKGWNGVLWSEIDFDYVELSVEQNLLLGTLGNSKYTLVAGKFINSRDLRHVDKKRFRQSDPYLYSDPLHSFQLLDTALTATDLYFEAHYIHHFNGAMINNIPLIKKLRLRTVAGAGMMWIKESNYRHEELFGGIERVFKTGPRRRLKVGLFGVLSQSNFDPPKTGFKVSFDLIDTWKRDWSY